MIAIKLHYCMIPKRKYIGTYIVVMLIFFIMTIRPIDLNLTRNSDITISFTIDVCNTPITTVHSTADMPFIDESLHLSIIMPICTFIALKQVFRYFVIVFPIDHPPEIQGI
ncbi:membrane protein [Candidatus Magnetobacterium bavaricum]|uniref:Membrane protein n=1 Tax=Candidatus Magnetobacterium bavaricum TaxID=29290 RepID=A0A0F3GQL3_9BACT|nr:membrane protein [Candidatus Magnetobacterium bavaricum]